MILRIYHTYEQIKHSEDVCLSRKVNDSTRLYFVSEPHFKRDTSLLYVDLPSQHTTPPQESET